VLFYQPDGDLNLVSQHTAIDCESAFRFVMLTSTSWKSAG
jgi:hypothetical protein